MTDQIDITVNICVDTYDDCVATLQAGDVVAGQGFYLQLEALNHAVDTPDWQSLKQFAEDCGKSYDYMKKLNRIRKCSQLHHMAETGNITFDACYKLLNEPEEVREEVAKEVSSGNTINLSDLKEKAKEVALEAQKAREKAEVRKEKKEEKKRHNANMLSLKEKFKAEDFELLRKMIEVFKTHEPKLSEEADSVVKKLKELM